ncbi:HIT family protein [Devosia rhizoryzae]|uniref:HIT domain-containing protein n=1 Tax=Devosia rhizoryzae TaxID=2774137 RepID=A0ABX7C2I2_9HYPH|nr:HIT domain-containing protein [Devosia rhizoryzae]QQR38408.1 HIT domain-containing protein [Devosia rhizoryzae]
MQKPECRFCRSNGLLSDGALAENASFFLLASIDPETPHGVMIITHRHIETPFELNSEEWLALPNMLESAKAHLSKWRPDGYTIGWNVGRAGGQSVAHAHLHVFARIALPGVFNLSIRSMLKKTAGAELDLLPSRRC